MRNTVLTMAMAVMAATVILTGCGGKDANDKTALAADTAADVAGTAADAAAYPSDVSVHPDSIDMVLVKGGTFSMGCTVEQLGCGWCDDKPQNVTVGSFYIGKTEVTQGLWKAVMDTNPSWFKGDERLPVEMVSTYDIEEFIRKLNAKTGKEYRLPTETEWEYAARGGSKSKGYRYSGGNTAADVAWYAYDSCGYYTVKCDDCYNKNYRYDTGECYGDNSGYKTHLVCTKTPNELGICDMSGNVYEFMDDNDKFYGGLRGGSFHHSSSSACVSSRYSTNRGTPYHYIGFRLAQDTSTRITDSRDGKIYNTITIAKQIWMSENLNYDVPKVKTDVCYDNKAENCAKYGRLYDWAAANKACPAGFHLPNEEEWTALENFVGDYAAKKLKYIDDWNDDGGGTNDFGFSALPGGYSGPDGSFGGVGSDGLWWSATESDAGTARYRYIFFDSKYIGKDNHPKTSLMSVRCVRDD